MAFSQISLTSSFLVQIYRQVLIYQRNPYITCCSCYLAFQQGCFNTQSSESCRPNSTVYQTKHLLNAVSKFTYLHFIYFLSPSPNGRFLYLKKIPLLIITPLSMKNAPTHLCDFLSSCTAIIYMTKKYHSFKHS